MNQKSNKWTETKFLMNFVSPCAYEYFYQDDISNLNDHINKWKLTNFWQDFTGDDMLYCIAVWQLQPQ